MTKNEAKLMREMVRLALDLPNDHNTASIIALADILAQMLEEPEAIVAEPPGLRDDLRKIDQEIQEAMADKRRMDWLAEKKAEIMRNSRDDRWLVLINETIFTEDDENPRQAIDKAMEINP